MKKIWKKIIAACCVAVMLMTLPGVNVLANEFPVEEMSILDMEEDFAEDIMTDNSLEIYDEVSIPEESDAEMPTENVTDESSNAQILNNEKISEDQTEAPVDEIPVQEVYLIEDANGEELCGYTNHSRDEAVAWIRARREEGWAKNYDGVAGIQCVDLIKYYFKYLTGDFLYGSAYQYVGRTDLPSGWYYTSTPSPGDIAVWGAYVGIARGDGHVALVESVGNGTFFYVDVNGTTGQAGSRSISNTNPSTFIHPDFPSSVSPHLSGAPVINVGSGVFVIHSARNDSYCLDIAGDSKENNANIQLYERINNDVQKFRIIKWDDDYSCIQSVHSGKWLDVKLPIGDNANVKLFENNSAEENDWIFEDAGNGYVYIRNRTGYYLDLQGDQAVNNANIQLYHFVGTDSQKWRLEDVTNYQMSLPSISVIHSARNDDYCLDIAGDSKENNANIQLYERINNDVQKFRIIKWSNDYSCIQSVYSGKWLDVKLPIGNNANVKLFENNSAEENDWIFEDAGNGYVYIRNRTGYYLDLQGDQAVNNANIQLYHFIGTDSQRWRIEDITNYINIAPGVYEFRSAWDENYCLDILNDSKENNANIQLYKKLNNDVQKFRVITNPNNTKYSWVLSLYSDKWLDVKLPIGDNANVKLFENNSGEEDNWIFENAGNGYVYIKNKTGYYLDVQGDKAVNNANIQIYHFIGNNSQKWKLVHAHTLTKTNANVATCTEKGNSVFWTCSGCGLYFSDANGTTEIDTNSWIIPAKGHTAVKDAAIAATCTTDGKTEGSHCSVCNTILKAQKTVKATGHDYSNNAKYCRNNCGTKNPDYIDTVDSRTDISNCTVTLSSTSYTYNGKARKPSVTVSNGTVTLTADTDYTVSYSNNTNAGTATVTITGKENYTGSISKTFTIKKATAKLVFAEEEISKTTQDVAFTNSLTKTTDGTVTFSSSNTSVATVNSSSGLVTIKGVGETTITASASAGKNYKAGSASYTLSIKAPAPALTTAGFTDVQDPSHPYYKAIYWAAEAGITKGYSDGTFGIDKACTRSEAVMFLWRLAGKPEPVDAMSSPFSDVPKTHAHYKAILWASQRGIAKGYSDGTFGINKTCTRGQIMTFIWRFKGQPAPKAVAKSPFSDVPKTHAYYNAILWGAQNGITNGYSDGTFGINKDCTRGQIVTFLYRIK